MEMELQDCSVYNLGLRLDPYNEKMSGLITFPLKLLLTSLTTCRIIHTCKYHKSRNPSTDYMVNFVNFSAKFQTENLNVTYKIKFLVTTG